MDTEVLHIGVSECGMTRMLRLTGELDSYTSGQLTSISQTWIPGARKVVINLDDLEYIDSAGLSSLVRMWLDAKNNGTQLVIHCRNPRIHRIFEITGLLKLFDVDVTRESPNISSCFAYRQPSAKQADGLVSQAGASSPLHSLRG
jgi:anti-anti-sigma factor